MIGKSKTDSTSHTHTHTKYCTLFAFISYRIKQYLCFGAPARVCACLLCIFFD